MSSTTTPPAQKVIDPPFYDPVLADGGATRRRGRSTTRAWQIR